LFVIHADLLQLSKHALRFIRVNAADGNPGVNDDVIPFGRIGHAGHVTNTPQTAEIDLGPRKQGVAVYPANDLSRDTKAHDSEIP
jgi:hypothetical protein